MWYMQDGLRVLTGAEWELFRIGLANLISVIELDIASGRDEWDTGVAVFDRLTAEQKIDLLAGTARAMNDRAVPAPDHTAANEGAIKAVLNSLCDQLETEVLHSEDGDTEIRRLLLVASAHLEDDLEELPNLDCTDLVEWRILVECLEAKILWDCEFAMGDEFLDLPPDEARVGMSILGIDPDYFLTVPDEPDRKRLRAARRELARLL